MSEIAPHTESANGIVKNAVAKENSPAKLVDHVQKGVEDVNDEDDEEGGGYEVCRGFYAMLAYGD